MQLGTLERWLEGVRHVDVDVVGDKQIKKPVAVVVDKGAARSEPDAVVREVSLFRHIGKRAVAVVAVELVLPVVGDEQIFEAVVVVVADTNAHRPAGVP